MKGLVDAGVAEIPAIFRAPPITLASPKPPIPNLEGGTNSITRRNLVETIGDAAEKWGVFQVINHGIPLEVLERMKDDTNKTLFCSPVRNLLFSILTLFCDFGFATI